MGKTSRWFRALLGGKKSSEKKKRASVRSSNADDWSVGVEGTYPDSIDANKHAIAMAAATAAVAEAALAAAQAAAEVVRMTGGSGIRAWSHRRREVAAVKIQSAFRAYLARRALRALKGLVRLQALVRGHIIRKQSADMLRRMQALARIQARVCAHRAQVSDTSHCSSKSSHSQCPSSRTNIKIKGHVDLERSPLGSTWLQQWMEECSRNIQVGCSPKPGHADDERSDKILEVDTWKPRCSTKGYDKNPSISSGEVLSLRSVKFQKQVDHLQQALASDSPQACSATSGPGSSCRRGAPSTPARSEFSRSVFSEFLGHPSYMASTESSAAKLRSLSAPRQRMHGEKPRSNQRFVPEFRDADTISEIGSGTYADFKTNVYPGHGYSNRTQTQVRSYSAARYRPHFEGL